MAGLLQGLDFLTQDAVASCKHQQFDRHCPFFAEREASSGNAAAGQRAQEKIEWATTGRRGRGRREEGEQAIICCGRRGSESRSRLRSIDFRARRTRNLDRVQQTDRPTLASRPHVTWLTTHHRDHVPHLGPPASALLKAVVDTINETRIPSCPPCADRARRRTPGSKIQLDQLADARGPERTAERAAKESERCRRCEPATAPPKTAAPSGVCPLDREGTRPAHGLPQRSSVRATNSDE